MTFRPRFKISVGHASVQSRQLPDEPNLFRLYKFPSSSGFGHPVVIERLHTPLGDLTRLTTIDCRTFISTKFPRADKPFRERSGIFPYFLKKLSEPTLLAGSVRTCLLDPFESHLSVKCKLMPGFYRNLSLAFQRIFERDRVIIMFLHCR
jgi:hypothetical protein